MTDQHQDPGDFVAFGSPAPSPRPAGNPPTRRTRKLVVGGLAAVLVGGVVAGGLAVGQFLSGGGTQPEDVLPADTVAFAKIDLDPSADQKINAFELLRKFPEARTRAKDLKSALLENLLKDNPYGLSYDKDIAPWIGDRAAVGAVADPDAKEGVAPVLAVQFTDEGKATTALDRIEALAGKRDPADEFHYAVRDDYVLITQTQAEASAFADSAQTLSHDTTYAADAESIDAGNQIALAWADMSRVYKLLPADAKNQLETDLGTLHPSGSYVAGLHVDSDYVEVVGQAHGFDNSGSNFLAAAHPGTRLVRGMPADVTGAMSLTGLGPALTKAWAAYKANDALGIQGQARKLGLHLPADLGAVFGEEFAVGVKATKHDFGVVFRVATDRPDRARQVLAPLLSSTGEPGVEVVAAKGGYAAGTDPALLRTTAAGAGGLGGNPTFTQAVKDADKANAILYVNLADLVRLFASAHDKADLAPLKAFGMSSTGDSSNAEFTARLTFR